MDTGTLVEWAEGPDVSLPEKMLREYAEETVIDARRLYGILCVYADCPERLPFFAEIAMNANIIGPDALERFKKALHALEEHDLIETRSLFEGITAIIKVRPCGD